MEGRIIVGMVKIVVNLSDGLCGECLDEKYFQQNVVESNKMCIFANGLIGCLVPVSHWLFV